MHLGLLVDTIHVRLHDAVPCEQLTAMWTFARFIFRVYTIHVTFQISHQCECLGTVITFELRFFSVHCFQVSVQFALIKKAFLTLVTLKKLFVWSNVHIRLHHKRKHIPVSLEVRFQFVSRMTLH